MRFLIGEVRLYHGYFDLHPHDWLVQKEDPAPSATTLPASGPLKAVHLSRNKWPGGLVNQESGRLSERTLSISMV